MSSHASMVLETGKRFFIIHDFLFQVTVVGTRVLQGVRAVDADQPGPYSTVEYSVLPGPHAVMSNSRLSNSHYYVFRFMSFAIVSVLYAAGSLRQR